MMLQKIATILLVHIILATSITVTGAVGTKDGVHVVVTFPFMLKDVENILCDGDTVYSLVPLGVDPHEYQITPQDFEILSKADLIISTAHTPFETNIKKLIGDGVLKAKLIEIPNIPGIKFLEHPLSGTINYHGLLMDINNYLTFIENVTNTLTFIRHDCSDVYRSKFEEIVSRARVAGVKKLLKDRVAVIDSPILQYLVNSLGAEVKHIVQIEHEVPITPKDIAKAEDVVKTYGNKTIMVVLKESIARASLNDIAYRYRVPFVELPNPLSYNSILGYHESVLEMISQDMMSPVPLDKSDVWREGYYLVYVAVGLALIVFIVLFVAKKH
uniref:ABC transporter substrate-binding protein n=1 Tax=Ignisphaera aggregans TaxID=334771 RepID=A0A7J3MXP7_9CREN